MNLIVMILTVVVVVVVVCLHTDAPFITTGSLAALVTRPAFWIVGALLWERQILESPFGGSEKYFNSLFLEFIGIFNNGFKAVMTV